MNWLDAIIAVVVVLSAFMGWKVGLIRTVLSTVGMAVGLFLAGQYYDDLGGWLGSFITSPNGAKVAGFIIIFLAVLLAAVILGKVLRALLRLVLLGWVDGLGGAALGALAGAAFSTGLCLGLRALPILELDRAVQDSLLGSFLVGNFPAVLALLPREFDVPRLPR